MTRSQLTILVLSSLGASVLGFFISISLSALTWDHQVPMVHDINSQTISINN